MIKNSLILNLLWIITEKYTLIKVRNKPFNLLFFFIDLYIKKQKDALIKTLKFLNN